MFPGGQRHIERSVRIPGPIGWLLSMADSGIPDKFLPAVRLAVFWIGLPFIFLLGALDRYFAGTLYQVAACLIGALASIAVAVYWGRLIGWAWPIASNWLFVRWRNAPRAIPLHMALHVSRFWADFTPLNDRLYFTISLGLFNQTDQNIIIEGVRGKFAFEGGQNLAPVSLTDNLPITVVAHNHDGVVVTIRQSVTKEEKDRICEIFAQKDENGTPKLLIVSFNLISLLIYEIGKAAPEVVRFYNLDGITCRLPKDGDVICGRSIILGATNLSSSSNLKL
jgi:hypothetical protein